MTELEKRRQRTQEFLNELGVKMPIVKFSTPTKEADLINNKNFISVASEIIFDKVMDSAMNEPKLHTAVFKNSFKRKFINSGFRILKRRVLIILLLTSTRLQNKD